MKERYLFLALVLFHLVPILAVNYLPTVDGPCHTYNAWILRQYGNGGQFPQFGERYVIDWHPVPNWLSHAVMALLMLVFNPRAAEKILVCGYIILFPAAARYAAGAVDPERKWLGNLAFPFIYNELFQLGFYNFSYSLALWLFVVGYWRRRWASPDAGFAVRINLLLLICWFCHIVSHTLALFAIGVLWLSIFWRVRSHWKRHLLHVLILAPQLILPLWFLAVQSTKATPAFLSTWELMSFFFRLEVLSFFDASQLWIGRALSVAFLLFLILTFAGRIHRQDGRLRFDFREEDGFLLLSLLLVAVFFASPQGMSGGWLLKERLALYPWLALLPWLAPRLPKRPRLPVRAAAIGSLAVLALWSCGYMLYQYRAVEPAIRAYIGPARHIPPNSRVLPLSSDPGPYGLYTHLIGYAAIRQGLITWDNYEAGTQYFPTRFRRRPRFFWRFMRKPGNLNLLSPELESQIDYIYAWDLNPESLQALHLRQHYDLVYQEGSARVYMPRTPP